MSEKSPRFAMLVLCCSIRSRSNLVPRSQSVRECLTVGDLGTRLKQRFLIYNTAAKRTTHEQNTELSVSVQSRSQSPRACRPASATRPRALG